MKPRSATEYLWDRTGEPDDMVCRLEDVLAELRRPTDVGEPSRDVDPAGHPRVDEAEG